MFLFFLRRSPRYNFLSGPLLFAFANVLPHVTIFQKSERRDCFGSLRELLRVSEGSETRCNASASPNLTSPLRLTTPFIASSGSTFPSFVGLRVGQARAVGLLPCICVKSKIESGGLPIVFIPSPGTSKTAVKVTWIEDMRQPKTVRIQLVVDEKKKVAHTRVRRRQT